MIRRLRSLFAAIALALGLVLVTAAASSAHAELVRTSPASSESLDAPPDRVVLEFNDPVRIPKGGVRVINESSERLAVPSPVSSNGGKTQSVALPKLKDGAYVVSWRAVSSDGHPVRGAFTFRVGQKGSQAAVAALAEKLLGEGGGPAGIGIVLAILRFTTFATTMLLIGGLGYARFVKPGLALAHRQNVQLVRISGIVAAVSGAATLLLYGPYVGGYGFSGLTDGTLLDDTLSDPVGRAIIAKAIGLALLSLAVMILLATGSIDPATPTDPSTAASAKRFMKQVEVVAVGLALTVLVAEVYSGHGNSGPHALAAGIATVVHVGAAALWVGGLVHVVIGAGLLRRSFGRASGTPAPATRAPAITAALERFSTVAFASVIAVVVSGLFASWRQVGSKDAATTTTYGRLLITKVLLVGVLLAIGGTARREIRERRSRTVTGPNPTPPPLAGRLGVEIVVAVLVLAATALLVNVAPAREAVAKPATLRLKTTSANIDITVDPARKGRNEIHVYTLKPTGEPLPIDHVKLLASKPGSDVEPLELRVLRAGPNHFQVLNADLPLKGPWTLEVRFGVDRFSDESATGDVELR